MKIQKAQPTGEREVLTGMIVNTTVLARIASKWQKTGMMPSPHSNIIGQLCVDFYRKHNSAPMKGISALVKKWAEGRDDESTVEAVTRFVRSLSDDYESTNEDINPSFVIDLAANLFNKTNYRNLIENVTSAVEANQLDKADKFRASFNKVELGVGAGVDIFNDMEAIEYCFAEAGETLIKYPGALGNFFAGELERDAFIAFQGPEKSGKSYWLIDMAYRAVMQKRKVVFFEVGDMSQRQVTMRFLARAARHPYRSSDGKWPVKVNIPNYLSPAANDDTASHVDFTEKIFQEPLTLLQGQRAMQRIVKEKLKTKKKLFQLKVYPTMTVTVAAIKSELAVMALDDWHPDCVAEGSLVLTNHGLVPIEKVRCSDRLWDGANWVKHDGPVYKGVRDVITYCGLTATPDHEIWTEQGWRTLESCSQMGLRISQTEHCGKEIRVGESYISDSSCSAAPVQEIRSDIQGEKRVCVCSMCQMQIGKMGVASESLSRNSKRMSNLLTTEKISNMVMAEIRGRSSTMYKSKRQPVETLWRERNRISFQNNYRNVSVGFETSGKFNIDSKFEIRGGSNQQRWALRARKSQIFNSCAKLFPHKKETNCSNDSQISTDVSTCQICRQCFKLPVQKNETVTKTNNCPMEFIHEKVRREKAPVWDILNAGPFHRFTVQGVLAHNCIFIDYADILAKPAGADDERSSIDGTWGQLRALSQELHCLIVTATQADAGSYDKRTQSKMNFSGDKRKNAHVTGMVGINVQGEEKERGLCRLNWIARREGEYSWRKCCTCAGALAIANPAILSSF